MGLVAQAVAGGLSGGLGSVIAGGDFWRGAQQGAIVAVYNHAVHQVTKHFAIKKSIKEALKNAGYSDKQIRESLSGLGSTQRKEKVLEILGRVKGLRLGEGLHKRGKWNINIPLKSSGSITEAHTEGYILPKASISSVSTTFYSESFVSLFNLTKNIHHELVHVQHLLFGSQYSWYMSVYKKNRNQNMAVRYSAHIGEYYSYKSTYNVTGDIRYLNVANGELSEAYKICNTCAR